ncbi:MAG TPA: SRPBCC family protein [Acidimicrobiales bacterium]|jgi:hypothetical protein
MAYPVAESRQIAAPPDKVWAMVSDLPRMGDWSPENVGGEWIKGATGPALGALFKGKNRNGFRRWSTTAKVIDCQPGTAFEIAITSFGFHVASWRYDFEPTPDGCTVTESWNDKRPVWMKPGSRLMGDHSGAHARQEMAATLANIAKAAE